MKEFQFSQYLKDKRGSRSHEQVALEAGVSRATWSRLERGYAPDLLTLMRIQSYFGDPYEVLIAMYIHDFMPEPEQDLTNASTYA